MSLGFSSTVLGFRRVALVCVLAVATGCTQFVDTPNITIQSPEPVPDAELDALLAEITPPLKSDGVEPEWHPTPRRSVDILRAGDDLGFSVTMTPEAEELWTATNEKDWQTWDARYDDAKASMPDTDGAAFLLSAQRLRAMMHAGRIADVRVELKRLEKIERDIFGNVLETISQHAQLNSWLNRSRESIAYNAVVVDAVGDWWLPEFYYAKPDNIGDAKRVAGAMMRSHIGLTCEHIVLHEYETAMRWGRAGLDMTESVLGISHHPLYGMFVKTTTYMYEGQAWMLACYAAARVGYSKNLEANRPIIDLAKAFFRQAQYRWGDYLVDSIIDYVLFDIGLKDKPTQRIGALPEPGLATEEKLASLVRARPENLQVREGVELPTPEPDTIKLPGAGATNAYGFTVSAAEAAANDDILAGRFLSAVERLDAIAAAEADPLRRWHAAEQAVKTLVLAGRAAEASQRVPALEKLEIAYFGSNIGARALRGEIKFWLGDNDGALRDFLQVAEALGDFRPPTLLVFKPDAAQMALLTRAQYLAYLGVARSEMYAGSAKGALPWAEAAEQLFEEAHYAWRHQLYRHYLKLDADLFYARGVNLAALAGARLIQDGDLPASERIMGAARAYLDAMGFDAGRVTIEAMWARALLNADRPAAAELAAAAAVKTAVDRGQTDLLWQLQALRGQALGQLDRPVEAEAAFRAADAAIESVSGALATDASKRQFGIGKDEITQQLADYALQRGDFAQAFADMERGRARAFVDMLASVRLAGGRNSDLVKQIRAVDADIRTARVLAATPGRGGGGAIAPMAEKRRALVARLRGRDSELADAMAIATGALADAQRRLGADDVMLYAVPTMDGDERIRFLVVRRGGVSLTETTLSHDRLQALLAVFTTDDPIGDALKQRDAAQAIADGLRLEAMVGSGTVYVAPTRALYFVPWGALPVESAVVVLPNGGWLGRSRAQATSTSAVVVGDPKLGFDWETLPGARQEATTVARLYRTRALVGADASVEVLRDAVGRGTRVLHLATHGVFDARNPLASSVLLSNAGEAEPLTAMDLFEKPLPASLVILSACETGLGQVSAGDDFLGLARSFYLGGARAVMNSLWPVHDKPTRRFMEVFHRQARGGDIGQAWLAARDALRKEGFPPSVYGAFVLGGADRI